MVDLEQSRIQIPDSWCMIFTFPLIATIYFTKTEDRTKQALTQLSYYYFE